MSAFADAFAVGACALDTLYGEAVQLVPQVNGPAAAVVAQGADPDRPAQDLVGILDIDPAISRVVGSGANTHDNIDVQAAKAQVDFDAAQFPTAAALPQQGDLVVATTRPGTPSFAIVAVEPDYISRIVCILEPVPAGAPS